MMATLKELMGDLKRGDGRKFKKRPWSNTFFFEPIFKEIENLWFGLNQYGMAEDHFEDDYKYWEPCSEPNTKKKIKLYSPVGKSRQGYIYLLGKYADKKELFGEGGETIIGWHEIELEVDL